MVIRLGEIEFGIGALIAFFSIVILWITSSLDPLSGEALLSLGVGLLGFFIFAYLRLESDWTYGIFIGIPAGLLIGVFTLGCLENVWFINCVIGIIVGIFLLSYADLDNGYTDPFILFGSWGTYAWAFFALVTPTIIDILLLVVVGTIAWIIYGFVSKENDRVFKLKLLLWGMLYLAVPLIVAAVLTTDLAWTLQVTGLFVGITATAFVLALVID